jgi:hypothetical protein
MPCCVWIMPIKAGGYPRVRHVSLPIQWMSNLQYSRRCLYLHSSFSSLDFVVVSWPCFVSYLCFSCLLYPGRALATPRFVVAIAERAFPGYTAIRLSWAVRVASTRNSFINMSVIDVAIVAIGALQSGEKINHTQIAPEFGVVRSTLTRRHQRVSTSRERRINTSRLSA